MAWTAEEARYAIDRLIARRKIRPSDVERALADRPKEIRDLRRRLAELESLGGVGRRQVSAVRRRKVKRPAPRRRKARLSAQARSRLRLQGKYMGYVRRLTAAQKSQVRKIRLAKGWQAAIRMARGLAKAGARKR
jgi:hypothetical protein